MISKWFAFKKDSASVKKTLNVVYYQTCAVSKSETVVIPPFSSLRISCDTKCAFNSYLKSLVL
jgi:hypothetical protein